MYSMLINISIKSNGQKKTNREPYFVSINVYQKKYMYHDFIFELNMKKEESESLSKMKKDI